MARLFLGWPQNLRPEVGGEPRVSTLFFYGTLRYRALLDIVMGTDASHLVIRPAILPGYQVHAVKEGPFPTLLKTPNGAAEGVVVEGLRAADIARLDFYEGGFGYDLTPVTLSDGTRAEVYRAPDGMWTPGALWSLEEWAADWAEMSCLAAAEVMSYLGVRSRDEVSAIFPSIRARAWSRILAKASKHGAGVLKGRIALTQHRRVYSDFFALDEMMLSFERFDGTMSKPQKRSVFVPVDAALVLPYDPVRDTVMLIEQVRIGPIARGDPVQWQYEPIAGRIDPGEAPQDTARREALEEAGLEIGALHEISQTYASPGNSTEVYHIFCGIADLPQSAEGVAGLASENEDIRSRVLPFEGFMAMAERLEIANTPLALCAYWLSHHRARLRSHAGGGTS